MRRKNFRSVIKIERIQTEQGILRAVYWAIKESETTRSISTKHYAVTLMGAGHIGTTAKMFSKPVKLKKSKNGIIFDFDQRSLNEAYGKWYRKFFHEKSSTGTISWVDERSGEGFIDDSLTGHKVSLFTCNVVGANNAYHHLVTNVKLNKGDKVKYKLYEMSGFLTCSQVVKV